MGEDMGAEIRASPAPHGEERVADGREARAQRLDQSSPPCGRGVVAALAGQAEAEPALSAGRTPGPATGAGGCRSSSVAAGKQVKDAFGH